MKASDERLVMAFSNAALFLIEHIKNDGWKWSSNYLREHVRCATDLHFCNTISPKILDVLKKNPLIGPYVITKTRKKKK